MLTRNCKECGKEFTTNIYSQIYCGKECRKEGLKRYRRNFMKNYWKVNSSKYIENRHNRVEKDKERKIVCFVHYSGNPPKCACCGEIEFRFLELDHINGGGNKEREKLFGGHFGGSTFYRWLVKHNFPEGYQVLCANCNNVKRDNNIRFCKIHHPELYKDNE